MKGLKLGKDMIMVIALAIFVILFFRQCESTRKAQAEITRTKNNFAAMQDTVRNFKDKDGNKIL